MVLFKRAFATYPFSCLLSLGIPFPNMYEPKIVLKKKYQDGKCALITHHNNAANSTQQYAQSQQKGIFSPASAYGSTAPSSPHRPALPHP
ncbi:hypothetical protein EON65_57115, partial [archaeon]